MGDGLVSGVDALTGQERAAFPVRKRPDRRDQTQDGDGGEQAPAQEGQIQPEQLHPMAAHAQPALPQAVDHAELRVSEKQVAGHPVAVQREKARHDQRPEAERDDQTGDELHQQDLGPGGKAVQQHPQLQLLSADGVEEEQQEAERNDGLHIGQQVAGDSLSDAGLDGGDQAGGGVIIAGQNIGGDAVSEGKQLLPGRHRQPIAEIGEEQDQQQKQKTGGEDRFFAALDHCPGLLLDCGEVHPEAASFPWFFAEKYSIGAGERQAIILKKGLTRGKAGAIISKRSADARVVELADSLDSGSSAHSGRAGSSPASRTTF